MSTLEQAQAFFDGEPLGVTAVRWVASVLTDFGGADIVVTRSQVAFRRPDSDGIPVRPRTVALLWRPGQYLASPHAPVVLSVPLAGPDPSPRWKEVAHPGPSTWMHHLEVLGESDLDAEVASWLRLAYER